MNYLLVLYMLILVRGSLLRCYLLDCSQLLSLLIHTFSVLSLQNTTVTQQVSHRPIKCQSLLWSQRCTKVNGSHRGDNPLLRPTGIQIATKSCATLQAMAPTNIKMVHQTSLLDIESSLDRLGLLSPTHDQPHESCPFSAPCGSRRKKNDRSQTSASPPEASRFAPLILAHRGSPLPWLVDDRAAFRLRRIWCVPTR